MREEIPEGRRRRVITQDEKRTAERTREEEGRGGQRNEDETEAFRL